MFFNDVETEVKEEIKRNDKGQLLMQLGSGADNAHGARTTDSLGDTTLVLGRETGLFP